MHETKYDLKVLVVEDDDSNLDVAVKMLSRLGCTVSQARDGYQAIEQWCIDKFDLIFMDCNLPVMDGYTATTKIRELEKDKNGHTIIIAFTADAMQYQKEKCSNAGMDGLLLKPVSYQDFERTLSDYS